MWCRDTIKKWTRKQQFQHLTSRFLDRDIHHILVKVGVENGKINVIGLGMHDMINELRKSDLSMKSLRPYYRLAQRRQFSNQSLDWSAQNLYRCTFVKVENNQAINCTRII